MRQFSLSANIEEGFASEAKYIVTPNARQVAEGIANGFRSGVHSYTITPVRDKIAISCM